MGGDAHAATPASFGMPPAQVWNAAGRRSRAGDAILVVFLLAQCLDGVLTYVGVATFGVVMEANPIVANLMTSFGHGAGLLGAKLIASGLGIALHLLGIHTAIAVLAAFYMAVAVAPWTLILFF
jgi:hypothetical protein